MPTFDLQINFSKKEKPTRKYLIRRKMFLIQLWFFDNFAENAVYLLLFCSLNKDLSDREVRNAEDKLLKIDFY